MKKNPKIIAGIAAMLILLGGLGYMTARIIPMSREVAGELRATPTPLPPVPDRVTARTPDPSRPTAAPVLRHGSVGPEVEKLQKRLQELGYYPVGIDGKFYEETEKAVSAFQKANGLTADGIAGEKTMEKLYSDTAVPKPE